MPNKFYIRPYKGGSQSAKTLADALGGKRLKLEGSNYRPKAGHVVINWGNSQPYNAGPASMLNEPAALGNASNKLRAFQRMFDAGVSVPPFTTDFADTADWPKVCVREKLSGHSGEGLTVADRGDVTAQQQRAPLFTKYIPKKEEYRIHVGRKPNGDYEVIFRQRKARKRDVADADVNWQVRNLAGGFIFAHNDIDVPGSVCNEAILALEALDLDFAAIDIILNERSGKAFVLEANTAPGLEGETVNAYVRFFQQF